MPPPRNNRASSNLPVSEMPESSHLETVQRQVDHVRTVMADNVRKAVEANDELDRLEDISIELGDGARQFHHQADQANSCWRRRKWTFLFALLLLSILVMLIVIYASLQ